MGMNKRTQGFIIGGRIITFDLAKRSIPNDGVTAVFFPVKFPKGLKCGSRFAHRDKGYQDQE